MRGRLRSGLAPVWVLLPAMALYGVALISFPAWAQQADQGSEAESGATGEVLFFVFDGDVPVEGIELRANGQTISRTGPDGGLIAELPAGRNDVVLIRAGEEVAKLDLLTAAGESVQVVVGLQEGAAPEFDIESSGTEPVLAQDDPEEAAQQAGLLEGTITGDDGEPVIDARVTVPERGRAVRTNDQGLFQIELPPGVYSIKVSHPEYATQSLDNLRVIPGKSVTAQLALGDAGVELADFVVTGDYEEGSIASELNLQRESSQVVSVIGAEQISRTGDGDAAEALQRVSGLVLERDKFVVIRGQPFRYSLTQFNGLPLPSPDPIIQAVPLDLFPESVLANIQVQKSYSANEPGNFGAGLIGLNTRTAPDQAFLELKVGTGGNSISTGEEGLTYEGSTEDGTGRDGGIRRLPSQVPSSSALTSGNLTQAQEQAVGRSFNDVFLPQTQELPPDANFELAGGRSFGTDFGTFGFIATASYDQEWRRTRERDTTFLTADLIPTEDFVENRTDRNVEISSLLGFSADWENHSLASNTFFIRDSQDRTQISEGFDLTSGDREERRYLLEFQRQELLLTQLLGEHDFELFQFDWGAQTAETDRQRPDRRDYSYQRSFGSDGPVIFNTEDNLERQFNDVDENLDSVTADVTVPVGLVNDFDINIAGGVDYTRRERDSATRRFEFRPGPSDDLGDPFIEQIINDSTIDDDGDVVEFSETTLGTDIYTGDTETLGYYVSGNVRFQNFLEVVVGFRRTSAEFNVETNNGSVGGFDRDFNLPAISLTGFITPDMQVRAAYGQTVSYPRLVELSATTFFNTDTGEAFIGNPDLEPTEIDSYDLRWEWYPTAVEALTAGVFYKELSDTIEEQFFSIGGGGADTTFINGDNADIIGVEFGGRLSLDRLGSLLPPGRAFDWLDQVYVQADVAFTDSQVELGAAGVATNDTRALTGQADNSLNFQVGYDGPINDLTVIVNRIGERLDRAGILGRPDVFQEPSTFLDVTYTLTIPEELPFIGKVPYVGEGQLKLKGRNLLGEDSEFRQGGRLQRRLSLGRGYSVSLKWNFF